MSQHAVLSEGGAAWRWLPCTHSELRLDLTLGCGQSFRWTGVGGGRVWTLTQTADRLWFHRYSTQPGPREGSEVVTPEHEEEEDGKDEEALRDYFQLKVQLGVLYQGWGAVDPHFKHTALSFPGVRMLRQDPTECLFSFICSSNNHVSRIQGMVGRLCQRLGEPLCQLGTETYHTFPSLHRLAEEGVEECLRALGFGYRARFLHQSACHILDMKGPDWLASLRGVAYPEARSALCALPGVGLKQHSTTAQHYSTALYSTVTQHSTLQHYSTAHLQHSTQHSTTAQHYSTALYSTVTQHSTLQHYSTAHLQHSTQHSTTAQHYSTALYSTVTQHSTLQHYSTAHLQHSTQHSTTAQHYSTALYSTVTQHSTLQHYSTAHLQHSTQHSTTAQHYSTALYSTVTQHSTLQHYSTAQHSNIQHSTTAQHYTAQ
ncbi:OGG1 lyase, partial [Amia calva]|nr:OGG1 lyase [Amia calva]